MENRESRAYLRQLRVTPRKVKIVLDLIRGKDVAKAMAILKNTNKMVCEDIEKLLDARVFLDLYVRVKENWRESDFNVANFGYKEES